MALLHIVVDGYNFLHASRDTDWDFTALSLEEAREAIVAFLAVHRGALREKVTVVFDGTRSVVYGAKSENTRGVEVIFSEPGETADEVICRMVAGSPNPRAFLVVTADRAIRNAVQASGARIIGPRNFLLSSQEDHERRRKRREAEPREKYEGTTPGQVEKWREILGFDKDPDE
ncbi:MAG: NYN domain-containing protein [Planctomycetes bacterium]|nr:NYN domain-containing protein [Planctomycetota bacterium]